MHSKIAAIGMAVTFGIGVWIAQPHGQSKPHGNTGPDWSLRVLAPFKARDLVTCMWTDNRERMLQQAKWGDVPTPVVSGWNGDVPRVTVKMSFGDKPTVHVLLIHAGSRTQLGHAQHIWASCSDIDNPTSYIAVELWKSGRLLTSGFNQPTGIGTTSYQPNATVNA